MLAPLNHQPTIQVLRQALEAKLPDYMMPTYIVTIPAIPLNTSGKLDVKALPPLPVYQRGLSRLVSRGASMEMDAVVRAAFEDVLGLPKGQVMSWVLIARDPIYGLAKEAGKSCFACRGFSERQDCF